MAQPTRLPGVSYNALAAYFVTTVTLNRRKVFLDHDFARFGQKATLSACYEMETIRFPWVAT